MTHKSNLFVEHDIQIAHRLIWLPGKCENIHGHSMTVKMTIWGHIDGDGILAGLDFGDVKKVFRSYLDTTFDHHLHLNTQDPWTNDIGWYNDQPAGAAPIIEGPHQLPGLIVWPGDPTTENFAKWIYETMAQRTLLLSLPIRIDIQETKTNGASYGENC